jgi:hypothetical protein
MHVASPYKRRGYASFNRPVSSSVPPHRDLDLCIDPPCRLFSHPSLYSYFSTCPSLTPYHPFLCPSSDLDFSSSLHHRLPSSRYPSPSPDILSPYSDSYFVSSLAGYLLFCYRHSSSSAHRGLHAGRRRALPKRSVGLPLAWRKKKTPRQQQHPIDSTHQSREQSCWSLFRLSELREDRQRKRRKKTRVGCRGFGDSLDGGVRIRCKQGAYCEWSWNDVPFFR